MQLVRGNERIYVVYSTCGIERSYFDKWLREHVDMRIVFDVSADGDFEYLTGNSGITLREQEEKQIVLLLFSERETQDLQRFVLLAQVAG